MKTIAIFVGCAGLVFMASALQLGLFDTAAPPTTDSEPQAAVEEAKTAPPSAKFPEDLWPVLRAQPVPQAKEYQAAEKNRLVFLRSKGGLHDWHEKVDDDWRADTVEKTELAVVLGPQYKMAIEYITFANGPPVTRYKHELDVYVVAARSGAIVGRKRFVSVARPIQNRESWELTALGEPVGYAEVFHWVRAMARAGFPPALANPPRAATRRTE